MLHLTSDRLERAGTPASPASPGAVGLRAQREAMLPEVYPGLRRLARYFLRRERPDHTLQPTALVHEAFLRLLDQREPTQDGEHLMALAAQMMRRILVNHALGRNAQKRGGRLQHVPLEEGMDVPDAGADTELLALDDALQDLAALDARQARIVELRYFTGLSIEETASAMGISPATVKRDWLTARLWLRRRLQE